MMTTLSAREQDVVRLIAEGATNERIARALALSTDTVKSHKRRINRKLGTNNATQTVVAAIRAGIVPMPPEVRFATPFWEIQLRKLRALLGLPESRGSTEQQLAEVYASINTLRSLAAGRVVRRG